MAHQIADHLEEQIGQLIERYQVLEQENQRLREREGQWRNERMQLLRNKETTRNKLEAMITRLKAMEQA